MKALPDTFLKKANISSRYPFNEISFSLWYFTHKLYLQLCEKNVKNVFFLSKEGQFLKTIFHAYLDNVTNPPAIQCHYFLASRRSTFLPSLDSLERERFDTLFRFEHYRNIAPREFLLSLNLSADAVNKILVDLDVDVDSRVADLPNHPLLQTILSHAVFQEAYEGERNEQKRNLLDYIRSYNVDIEEEGFHLVDVGWKGSMQDNLRRILDEKITISGYYLGLKEAVCLSPSNQKQGILFSVLPEQSPYFRVYDENWQLFETLLGASHGSANRYVARDGTISVETLDQIEETSLFNESIQQLQKKLATDITKLCAALNNGNFTTQELDLLIAKKHARIVFLPSKKELQWFKNTYHYQHFGVFEFTRFDSEKVGFVQRIKNLGRVICNRKTISMAWPWPVLDLYNKGLFLFSRIYGIQMYFKVFSSQEAFRNLVDLFRSSSYKTHKK